MEMSETGETEPMLTYIHWVNPINRRTMFCPLNVTVVQGRSTSQTACANCLLYDDVLAVLPRLRGDPRSTEYVPLSKSSTPSPSLISFREEVSVRGLAAAPSGPAEGGTHRRRATETRAH